MEKKTTKLKLNKETLVSLQEKQMNALAGGAALISDGVSSGYTCAGSGGSCTPVTNTCSVGGKCEYKLAAAEAAAASCCKKTCN